MYILHRMIYILQSIRINVSINSPFLWSTAALGIINIYFIINQKI